MYRCNSQNTHELFCLSWQLIFCCALFRHHGSFDRNGEREWRRVFQ